MSLGVRIGYVTFPGSFGSTDHRRIIAGSVAAVIIIAVGLHIILSRRKYVVTSNYDMS